MKFDLTSISRQIKEAAKSIGFDDCGIARAGFLKEDAFRLSDWLKQGYHAEMNYMERYFEKRTDPRMLVPGAKSVISVLLNYKPDTTQKEEDNLLISKFAYGKDYHYIIKAKLHRLMDTVNQKIIPVNGRYFVDSAPLLDRAWAYYAGLGWLGKNTNLISPKHGSFVFIGTLVVDVELIYDKPIADHCGNCRKCIDACPTNALIHEKVLDARKCISYLTIENRKEIPEKYKSMFGNKVFGCDICQDVCPWNKKVKPNKVDKLQPQPALLKMTKEDWKNLDVSDYQKLFKHSVVKRVKYQGLKRNIDFVLKNA